MRVCLYGDDGGGGCMGEGVGVLPHIPHLVQGGLYT